MDQRRTPRLFSIPAAAQELGPAFPVATIRDRRYHALPRLRADGTMSEPNGFADAFVKVGGKVLVDLDRFVERLEQGRGR
jgi:hypothetical protein